MPFDGNGNWTSTFSAVADRDANIKILASRFDNIFIADITAAFDNCLTRDGQGKPLANFNANNYRVINVADAVNAKDAINKQTSDNTISGIKTVEVGTIIAWPVSSTLTGYLICDGSAISRTTYADLFAVIGTIYGTGDGSTTFNLPDFRGRFLRGYLSGTTAALGTAQADQNKAHTHTVNPEMWRKGADGQKQPPVAWSYGDTYWQASGELATSSSGGSEARPINYAVNWLIKY